MKKKFLFYGIFMMITFLSHGQIGVKLGYINANAKVELDSAFGSTSESESQGGATLGVFYKGKLYKKLFLEPTVQYAFVDEINFLFIPVHFKYYVFNKFSLLAGPQGTFVFGDTEGISNTFTAGVQGTFDLRNVADVIDRFGLDFSFGVSYDFTENFFIEARYAFELTNRTPDELTASQLGDTDNPILSQFSIDANTKFNSFHLALGYKF